MVYQPKESDDQYTVQIIGKNIEVTNPIDDYIREHIAKMEKMAHNILSIVVRLEVQKLAHRVDISMHVGHTPVIVHATMEDLYASIDRAFEKLQRKLSKWKGKIQDHHAKGLPMTELEVSILENAVDPSQDLEDEIIDENNSTLDEKYTEMYTPKVVKTKTRYLKILTTDEAVMKMELSGDNFMVYKDEVDNQLKVIYKRPGQSYGIMSLAQ